MLVALNGKIFYNSFVTHTDTGSPAQQALPQISTPQWLFDKIMSGIEPELTSEQYPFLAEKYRGESEEERAERMARYQRAFAEYEEALQSLTGYLKAHADDSRRIAQRERSQSEAVQHHRDMQVLDGMFDLPSAA